MTKHDYQAALEVIDGLPHGKDTEEFLLGASLADCLDEIRHALKLAAIVTGEPSEGMIVAGHVAFNSAKDGECEPTIGEFKAMIDVACKQAEGV